MTDRSEESQTFERDWRGETKYPDITHTKSGRWYILQELLPSKGQKRRYVARCECGTLKILEAHLIFAKRSSKSCGCFRRDDARRRMLRHGATHSGQKKPIEYETWVQLRARCHNRKSPSYKNYGGRGIKICERWNLFEHFLADMGQRPGSGYSIDRINNNGDYEPENCRWATMTTQAQNTRWARWIEYKGQRLNISDWARILGFHQATLWHRIYKYGWSIEKAFNTPAHKRRCIDGRAA